MSASRHLSPALLVATANPGKLREIASLLSGTEVVVLSLNDFPSLPELFEDGDTTAENAATKARQAAMATGFLTVADDSALEIDALDGAPGVHSRRFAGDVSDEERNRIVLEKLTGVPPEQRTARFRCSVGVATPEGEVEVVEATCEGFIATEPKGAGGFGYDPIFILKDDGQRMAELSVEEKNEVSHRGKALRLVRPLLERRLLTMRSEGSKP